MTFVSISLLLKNSNFLENKSHVFERSNCTITLHDDLYYKLKTQQRCHIKSKHPTWMKLW